jgi:nodulation protein E
VTGLGAVSALGPDVPSFFAALKAGQPGIRPLECALHEPLRFANGAEVSGYCPDQHFDAKQLGYVDRFAQFAIVAAREAVRDARLPIQPERTAIITGTGGGGQGTSDAGFYDVYYQRLPRVNPMTIPRIMSNSGASQISMELGVTGPVYTVSTACSSSNHAIGQAFWSVRSGLCDAAITGGSECVFSYGFLKAWEAMRVVSSDTCRPFSKNRKGLILGEGGAMLVLEDREAAMAGGHASTASWWVSECRPMHTTSPSLRPPERSPQCAWP